MFQTSLGDKHAIKWIAVMRRQTSCGDRVGRLNWQRLASQRRQNVVEAIDWKLKSAERTFDRDFPRRDGTDKHQVFGGSDGVTHPAVQPGWIRHGPEQHMGVEQ